MKTYSTLICATIVFFGAVSFAVAQGETSGGWWLADPWWFPLFEIFGFIIGIICLSFLRKIQKKLGASLFGNAVRFLEYSLISFTVAIGFRAILEIRDIKEFILYEILFEALVYVGLVCIAIAAQKLFRAVGGK